MNSTKHLLNLIGDQQLRHCPPNVWPCHVVDVLSTRIAVIHHERVLFTAQGRKIGFPALLVWHSNPDETHAFCCALSLN